MNTSPAPAELLRDPPRFVAPADDFFEPAFFEPFDVAFLATRESPVRRVLNSSALRRIRKHYQERDRCYRLFLSRRAIGGGGRSAGLRMQFSKPIQSTRWRLRAALRLHN